MLLEGRAGTGKTVGAMLKLITACRQYPGSRHLLCRETRASMTDTTLVTFESVLGESLPEVTRVSREQRHSYRINGSEVVCAGLDEPSKAFGSAWGLVVLEEAIESTLDTWELFARAARDPKFRRHGEVRNFPYHQRIAITNPGPPDHWLNKRAFPCGDRLRHCETWDDLANVHAYNRGPQPGAAMRRMISVHQDNPTLFDTKTFSFIAEGIRYRDSLRRMGGSNLARMFYGLWQTARGAVFPSFSRQRHVVKRFPRGMPTAWSSWLSEDPGFDHPTAIAVATIAPNGRLYFVADYVRSETTCAEDAKWISDYQRATPNLIRQKLGDPHYMFSANKHNNGETVAQQMQKLGHCFVPAPAANNPADLDAQVQLIRAGLDTNLSDGLPAIQFIEEDCLNLITAMESHPFKRNARGERRGSHDEYSELYKDEIDAIRMIVASRPQFAPQSIRLYGQTSDALRPVPMGAGGKVRYVPDDDEGE